MSEKGKTPSITAIMEEYKKQGKTLTTEEAENIRKQIQKDLESGHIDARDDIMFIDALDNVVGGVGGSPIPTKPDSAISSKANDQIGSGLLSLKKRPV